MYMLFKDLKAGEHFLEENSQPIKDPSGIRVVLIKLAIPVIETRRTISDSPLPSKKPLIYTARFVSPDFKGQLTAVSDATPVTKLIM